MRQIAHFLLAIVLALASPSGQAQSAAASNGEAGLCNINCGDDGEPPPPPPPPPPPLGSEFVSQVVPTTMYAGQPYTVSVTMKNTGSSPWTDAENFRLGSQNPQDNMTWGTGRVAVTGMVVNGQSTTFTFNVVAPKYSGTYGFQWRMVQDGVAWFGATTGNVAVVVKAINQLPTVTITTPSSGITLQSPASLTVSAAAADSGGSVASVSFWSNGVLVGTDVTAPYSWTLSSLPAGTYQIIAVATDNEGASSSSLPVSVNVAAPGGTRVSATRTYVYDTQQRLCKTIEPESGTTVLDYDASGNLAWSAEGLSLPGPTCDRSLVTNAQKVTRSYDKLNRLASISTPAGTADMYQSYFPDGQLKSVTATNPGKNAKVTTTYAYNRRRLLTSESSSNGSTLLGLEYSYDANGNLSSLTYPDAYVVSFAPDALGRATRVTGAGGRIFASEIHYAPNGAISDFVYGNGICHVRQGNARQLPSRSLDSYFNGASEVKVLDDAYLFDANGNVTDITDRAQNGLATRGMAYDPNDRLVAAVSPQQWGNAVYGYDALDNLRVADQGSRQYRYNYDAANRLASIKSPAGSALVSLAYDSRGNTAAKNNQAFVFDQRNRLSQVTGSQTYRYDGLGRRVQTTDSDGKTSFWIYAKSGQVLYASEARRLRNLSYIYLGGSQIATRAMAWGVGIETINFQHTDALGSPVAETDQGRNIVNRYSYTPYGETFGPSTVDGTGYTGHVMDRATGLTYMQQRYYDPQMGVFLSRDPVSTDTQNGYGFNRYWYANANPYRFTDPDGRSVVTKIIKLAIKGGDVAATVAGLVDDVNTLRSPTASAGEKILAGASLLSEVVSPVSIGDVKDAAKAVNSVSTRYRRANYRYNSGSPAAKTARESAAGKSCPKCGETMIPGTRTAPQAQHEPPLSTVHYEHGGAEMTSAEKKAYANSPEALDGANCAQCQSAEGARQRQYVREQEQKRSE